jgi:hypothetical protein
MKNPDRFDSRSNLKFLFTNMPFDLKGLAAIFMNNRRIFRSFMQSMKKPAVRGLPVRSP